jgi:hypothetical protein
MLNEDALLLLLALGACTLVALGTLELVWPTRPKHPRRRSVSARDLARRVPPHVAPARRPAPPPRIEPAIRRAPPVAPPEGETPPAPALAPDSAETVVVAAPAPAASDPASDNPPPAVVSSGPATSREPDGTGVEAGFALLNARRFDEVVALTQGMLNAAKAGAVSPPGGAAQDAARLWGLMGLAKQGLDDFEGARFALEEAVATASGLERAAWEGHLVSLTLAVGRRAVAHAGTAPAADRVASLTSAIEWLERGLAISPIDTELRNVAAAAREALWTAREAVVNELLERRETAEARRVLEDVTADPECPPERRLAFLRLLDGVNASGPA